MTIPQFDFDNDLLQEFADSVQAAVSNIASRDVIIEGSANDAGNYIVDNRLQQLFTRIYSFVFTGNTIPLGFNVNDFNIYSIYGSGKLNNEVFVIPSSETNVTLNDTNMTLELPGKNNAEVFIKITYGA